jgi:luciferase family oxidoreductase group 1
VPELRLSVLDQSPIVEGSTGSQALHNTLDLAAHVDRLGYTRYWLAEHHGLPSLAGTSPEALIGPVAAATERIRVGSGGVMLPYYSAFKVAETFSVLSGLYPGRIDLALGRAPGGDAETAVALQRVRGAPFANDFPEQIQELAAFLHGRVPAEHPWHRLTVLPGRPEIPDIWLLGSSQDSAIWAAGLGLPYAFADFINPNGSEIASLYRVRFTPGEIDVPRIAVGVSVVCAETDDEAERLAASSRMAFSLLRQGRPVQIPPVEKAVRYFEERGRPASGRRMVVGSPETVRAGIEEVAAAYGADEVIVLTITYEHARRKRSYDLLAEAFELRATA